MEARATLSNVRISPRKVQIVLDLIRNKPTDVALATLALTPKAASPILEKLVKSAIANADNNHSMNKDSLYARVSESCISDIRLTFVTTFSTPLFFASSERSIFSSSMPVRVTTASAS